MPPPPAGKSSVNWTVIVLGLGVLAVVALAILYRSAGFNIEVAGPDGQRAVFRFEDNRVNLSQLLDRLLSDGAVEGIDAVAGQRLVKSVLREHGFYYVPSVDAATAIRGINKDAEGAGDFVRALRRMLYDLAGPFARPATLAEADDDRLLSAFDDLYAEHPDNPLVAKLWEMSLETSGFLSLRQIDAITVRVDSSLKQGVAATCLGSVLLEKTSLILAEKQVQPVEVALREPKPCTPTSARGLLKGDGTQIWISLDDMDRMFEDPAMRSRSSFAATIVPFPKHLRNLGPGT